MNEAGYDVAIPGNHEFDYGMDNFFYLVNHADFPYISCNFTKNDELVLPPYKIIEKGEYIYGFMEGDDGKKLYDSVQKAVDEVRSKGADYVYVIGHVGNVETDRSYTFADIIANTNGIDVFLDGHSLITSEGIKDTGLWSWTNDVSAISLLGIDNKFESIVNKKMQEEVRPMFFSITEEAIPLLTAQR